MEVNHQKFILFKISFEYESFELIENMNESNDQLYFNLEKNVWDLVKRVILISFACVILLMAFLMF